MAYNENQKKYSLAYAKENLKRVPLDLKKEKYEQLLKITKEDGVSINGFIKEAIDEKIKRRQ